MKGFYQIDSAVWCKKKLRGEMHIAESDFGWDANREVSEKIKYLHEIEAELKTILAC